MIRLTRIPRAALKDVRLADGALFMPMYYNSIQWRLTPWASLLVGIGGGYVVVHLNHGVKSPTLNEII